MVAGLVDAEGLDPGSLPRDRSALAFLRHLHQHPARRPAPGGPPSSSGRGRRIDHPRGRLRRRVPVRRGAPLMPLRQLDPRGRGGPRRVLQQGLRALPSASCRRPPGPAGAARWLARLPRADGQTLRPLHQAAMVATLRSGAFERHVRRMRRVYAARRMAALPGLRGGGLRPRRRGDGRGGGLHLALRFAAFRFDEATVSRIASAGARADPASRYAFAPYPGLERIALLELRQPLGGRYRARDRRPRGGLIGQLYTRSTPWWIPRKSIGHPATLGMELCQRRSESVLVAQRGISGLRGRKVPLRTGSGVIYTHNRS